jgi:hypothetical protein
LSTAVRFATFVVFYVVLATEQDGVLETNVHRNFLYKHRYADLNKTKYQPALFCGKRIGFSLL